MHNSLQQALHVISHALTFGINPSLAPMERITELLGTPQNTYRCIQVAGTNGKSSTSRYLAALLRLKGFKVGLYTSPELVHITDRIEIDGTPVDDESFAKAVLRVHDCATANALELTEFELITASALLLFKEAQVQYAVLEVGLGGRWDATSVVDPALAVLTGVDLDHTQVLGDTLEAIAAEKAAIIQSALPVVLAPTHPEAREVFEQQAARYQAPVFKVPAVALVEGDSYQAQNKQTALEAAYALLGRENLNAEEALATLDALVIPGRREVLHQEPLLIIDAAHNPASAATLARTLDTLAEPVLLLAVLADKDAEGIIQALAPQVSSIVVTQTSSSRALPAAELASLVESITGESPTVFASPALALETLLKQHHPVVATGSITMAGEVKGLFCT